MTAAILSGCVDGDLLAGWEWDQSWLSTVVCSADVDVVPELLAALARSEHRDVRLACVYAAIDAMNARRSLPRALAPMLADPDIGIVRGAVSAIRISGFAAQAADELAALTARELELESPRSVDPLPVDAEVLTAARTALQAIRATTTGSPWCGCSEVGERRPALPEVLSTLDSAKRAAPQALAGPTCGRRRPATS
ncbi:hypothetical protein [Allokutzneria albata]|uniref:hypothetical protein n=1 Tax=Allokutzneria albata TaxID=211114 RepID=UPI0004C34E37|nr:hypothetical protein [Allokutzneria albata]